MWELKLINKKFTLNKERILVHNFQNCNETVNFHLMPYLKHKILVRESKPLL
jgi:hypothetical protein